MTAARRQGIRQLAVGYRAATAAFLDVVEGLAPADLDAAMPDGQWTPRMVVHHMADAETRSAIRLRQLLAEDDPVIVGYDEAEYARRLPYRRPIEASLALVVAVRGANADLLDHLDAAALNRYGTHTESGRYGVPDWLEIYTTHPREHAAQIVTAVTSSGGARTR